MDTDFERMLSKPLQCRGVSQKAWLTEDPVHIEVWCLSLHLQPQPSHQAVLSLFTASTPEPWGQPPGPLHLAAFPTRVPSALPSRRLHTSGTTHCQPVPFAQLADVHLSWSGGVQPLLRFCRVCLSLCTKLILDRLCHGRLTCCEVSKLISLLGHFCSFYFSSSSSLSKFQLISHQKFASLLPYFLSLVLHEPYYPLHP